MKQAPLEIPARRPDTAPGLAAPRDAIPLALRQGIGREHSLPASEAFALKSGAASFEKRPRV
jgi:hypothetical protein